MLSLMRISVCYEWDVIDWALWPFHVKLRNWFYISTGIIKLSRLFLVELMILQYSCEIQT